MQPLAMRKGFALVELLVVTAVIAILVSILAPSLRSIVQAARRTVCQHRLSEWGKAFHSYASMYERTYPHIDGLDRDNGPADQCGWVDVLPPLINHRPWRDYGPYEHPKPDTFYHCPAAELSDGGYGYYPKRDGYFSYAMNSCLELDADCYTAPGQTIPMPSFLQTGQITDPARTPLLFDQLLDPYKGYGGDRRNRSAGKYCGSYPRDFAVRHRRPDAETGGSILYCDYSVRWVRRVWKDDWPVDSDVPPRDDPDWFPYPEPG